MNGYFIIALTTILITFSSSNLWAANCQGQTRTCFDGCSGGNITVYNADTCEFTFDSAKSCNRGWGSCSDTSAPCEGETRTCFDGCSRGNITVYNADTCRTTYDSALRCNKGWGFCSQ